MSKNSHNGVTNRRYNCEKPSTDSPCGQSIYLNSEKDIRAFPSTIHGTDDWITTYEEMGFIGKKLIILKIVFLLLFSSY